jgi:scyllo-inositol 2-dehydrogenase (NADP+)
MVNVGLSGFGLAGRVLHSPLIKAAGMPVTAVVTRRANEVAAVLPGAAVVDSYQALLARDDVDLVVIVTPNHLHASQAMDALRAGKHVVIDKPMCVHTAEADSLIALARERGLQLSVFHNRRWDSDFLTLAALVGSGRLGEVVAYNARWDRYRPQIQDRWKEYPEPGTGLFYDLGSHLIDQVLCLFGRPEWVQADIVTQRPASQVDDAFELWMGKGRLRISLGGSSFVAENRFRYRVVGERATFIKSGLDPQEDQLRADLDPLSAGFGVEQPEYFGRLTAGQDGKVETIAAKPGRWLTFYEGIRRSIESGAAVPVEATQVRTVIEIIEAALQSSSSGRRIALPS